jgi:hypothetical protein
MLYEVHNLRKAKGSDEMPNFRGEGVGVVVDCEGGTVSLYGGVARDKEGKEVKRFSGGMDHFVNFIDAVRSRKHADLHADILEGHLSSALCHTGNISYRLGQKKSREELEAALKTDATLTESFGRMAEHLAKNNVDVTIDRVTLGMALTMDPQSERFIGNDQASAMLTREYRAPFVVPEKV